MRLKVIPWFIAVIAVLLVGTTACSVLGASEGTGAPDTDLLATADAQINQRIEARRAARTPTPQATPEIEATVAATAEGTISAPRMNHLEPPVSIPSSPVSSM